MKKITITLELRVPDSITPGTAAHRIMHYCENDLEWKVDSASAQFGHLTRSIGNEEEGDAPQS